MKKLTIPIHDEDIRSLKCGEPVLLNGIMVTARDRAHSWLYDFFITRQQTPSPDDRKIHARLLELLDGGILYHCGPIVRTNPDGTYSFVAAGPTTSIREEPYQSSLMHHFNLKGVIGKGGMGTETLKACQQVPAVYFHAVGGTGALTARSVQHVAEVHKLEFGSPEALWVIQVSDFPAIVTMDANGNSLHQDMLDKSKTALNDMLKNNPFNFS